MRAGAGTPALRIDPTLERFVANELLPDLGMDAARFWSGFADIVAAFTPENRELLAIRDGLQRRIDAWHLARRGQAWDAAAYAAFLREIGYLEPEAETFTIGTRKVDPEIATVAGPQLVVPVSNARFAINAANARWGSLYDALYGTDVIPDTDGRERSADYNPARGAVVVARAAAFLDEAVPLANGAHADVAGYRIETAGNTSRLCIDLAEGSETTLAKPDAFVGYREDGARRSVLLRHHGLHVEILIDPAHPVGRASPAGVCDVVLEAAVTTIQDCEDSVAAVSAEDKVGVYRNWLGLMRGTLTATFEKDGRERRRCLKPDRRFVAATGGELVLPGRSLMLVRNVGHLMTTPAVRDADGEDVFEGLLDAVITTACALHDLRGPQAGANSRTGSIYIVKPKMHGPREAAFADRLFAAVEDLLGLERNTVKLGVMDEERRTSVNLAECIRRVRDRLVFINTGFLDRTGDEIHTSMEAGAMLPKDRIRQAPWLSAYEDRNVDVGIRCGLPGRAQIGKGMWAKPDEMRQMLDSKHAHPAAGASCAWVPSPTAATLHAMHYHAVDVAAVQAELAHRAPTGLDELLTPPLLGNTALAAADIRRELDNNAQGILGYVVRWIDQGVGCSKVPDIDDVALMEDRATLRISSQHMANWLHHDICTREAVEATLARMAAVVDAQNAGDPAYTDMAPACDGPAFQAARALVFEGRMQPNGYTEPLLYRYRRGRSS
ncbi:MAG TPA: malate synthase G [Woeseiaceae bacterium]|nr:malate synthase G [Woeseiaceae bacterium]